MTTAPLRLRTQRDLDSALATLCARDPRLAAVAAAAGAITLRRRAAGFPGLLATVVGQQLSIASAGAIWQRCEAMIVPLSPEKVRAARTDRLARIGLSAAKIRTFKAVAVAIANGDLDLAALARCDADSAHAALTAVHGIGPWTADIYLLFCLGHADAWPAGDLALQVAAAGALGLGARPDTREMIALAEVWRPWRGVAAHLFWAYYKATKSPGFAPAPPDAPPRRRAPRSGTSA